MNVSKSAPNPLSTAFIAACVESGIPAVDDYNDLSSEGAAHMQMNARNGLRCSTAAAYLEPAKHRRNLTVMPQSLATEICFDGKRATGVKFRGSDGSISHASARREVILSAGAIRSPQLLELSGVGNGALLQQLGVDLVHHNPHVGENLQDHLMVRLSFECTSAYTVNDLVLSRVRMAKALLRYALRRDGLIATAGICGTAFTRSRAGVPIPDVRLQLGLSSGTSRLSTSIETGLDACSGFHLGGYFIYPESRGSIHATSPDPTTSPVIDPHYLGSRVDQDTTVRVLKRLRQIAAQPSLARLIRRPLRHSIDATDEDLLEHARSSGSTCWHPIATCRMGSREDAVVDHKLRVHGLQGLRVADASVIPFHVSSNTNIPSVMIGERASDFIRQSARQAE